MLVPAAATTVPVPADDDAMNIVENAPIPALGMVACLPTVRRESVRLKARRQPTGSLGVVLLVAPLRGHALDVLHLWLTEPGSGRCTASSKASAMS